MSANESLFMCPTCFEVSAARSECHGHTMVRFVTGRPGDDVRKPVMDGAGRLESRAPRWFWQSIRQLQIVNHTFAPLESVTSSSRQH